MSARLAKFAATVFDVVGWLCIAMVVIAIPVALFIVLRALVGAL